MRVDACIFFFKKKSQYKTWAKQTCVVFILLVVKTGFLFSSNLALSCSIPSPTLQCLSVSANGDVTLNWTTPTTDPSFNGYFIYKASSLAGPYTVVDSVFSSSQATYTHTGANANAASIYYFVQTRCLAYVYSPPVDTLKTMHLTVANPLNGTALLTWNTIKTPLLPSAAAFYNIYREYPTGVWTLIATKNNANTNNLNFIDTIYICNSLINYRIEITDNTGCTSVSSVSGQVLKNILPPNTPTFDTLSVDNTNSAIVSWYKSNAPDAIGYVIYKFNAVSRTWIGVDTIKGINSTSTNYTLSVAGTSTERYRLAAYDSCSNISPLSNVDSTIFVTATADICNHSVNLNWTAYYTIGTGLSHYLIYQSTIGLSGPYTIVGSVPAGILNYTITGLAPATNYYYKITAVDVSSTKTASSNRIAFYSALPKPPAFLYLRIASVTATNTIELTCHIDVNASVSMYKIFRAIDTVTTAADYIQIGELQPATSSPIIYTDSNVKTNEHSYYYKIVIVDSCGSDGIETNIGRTILLKAVGHSNSLKNNLSWNNYEDWQSGVSSYNIYRGVDGVMNPTPIANVPALSVANNYIDDVSEILSNQGVFNYYVEAIESGNNVFSFSDKSLSNIADAYQDPLVYIPNAFFPEGNFTPVFKPVTTFVNYTDYEFSVFNREGRQLFSTKNVDEGWNGTYNGNVCELGVYVYLLKFKTSRGDYKTLKGSITLLK